MKHRLILAALVIALLAGFGALLHSPPSVIDAVTGATPKAKKAAQADAKLDGKYIFCINPDAVGLSDEAVREELKAIVSGDVEPLSINDSINITVYVSETDYALARYAKTVCSRFEKSGVNAELKKYSSTMLRSRAVSGNYEAFFAAEDMVDAAQLKEADYIILDSTEMR